MYYFFSFQHSIAGIGWHEARIPTIATMVPPGTFAFTTEKLRPHVSLPLVTSNRINTPAIAEKILSSGHIDLVSLARPLLADAQFVRKAMEDKADEINVCIGCNQSWCEFELLVLWSFFKIFRFVVVWIMCFKRNERRA